MAVFAYLLYPKWNLVTLCLTGSDGVLGEVLSNLLLQLMGQEKKKLHLSHFNWIVSNSLVRLLFHRQ